MQCKQKVLRIVFTNVRTMYSNIFRTMKIQLIKPNALFTTTNPSKLLQKNYPHLHLTSPKHINTIHSQSQHHHTLKKPHTHMKQTLTQLITHHNHPLDHLTFIKLINNLGFSSSCSLFNVFHNIIDLKLCNSVIKTYTHLKKHWHSLFVYVQMHNHGICPDFSTFPAVIKSIGHLRRRRVGKSVHCSVIKMGFGVDLFANTSLVHMYCSCAAVRDGRKVFDEMEVKNCVAWNSLVNGLVQNKRFLEGIGLFEEMLDGGVEAWEVTMVGVLSACANLGGLRKGKWVHEYVRRNGLVLNVFVGSALIDMFGKCGDVEKGCEVFGAMRVKNVCTWNVLIAAYAMNGLVEDALMAFNGMVFEGYKPDDVTFLAVLSACYNQGLVNEGWKYFRSMEDEYGVERKIEHYGCMVDLLLRAGFVEDAAVLIRTMPFVPDPGIWRALLRATQIQRKTHLTELVILKLIELAPSNGDNFLLLSNLYAQQQRWTELRELREHVKDIGIKNIPGYSSIEINGVIYEFVASFDRDPGLEDVYELLSNMYIE